MRVAACCGSETVLNGGLSCACLCPPPRLGELKALPTQCWRATVMDERELKEVSQNVKGADPRTFILSTLLAQDYQTDYGTQGPRQVAWREGGR